MKPVTVIVEDTENFSPEKFQRMSQSSDDIIKETPTKYEGSSVHASSAKKLFCESTSSLESVSSAGSDDDKTKCDINMDDVIPSSQDSCVFEESLKNNQEINNNRCLIDNKDHVKMKPLIKRRHSLRGKEKTDETKTEQPNEVECSMERVPITTNFGEFKKKEDSFISSDDDLPLSLLATGSTQSSTSTQDSEDSNKMETDSLLDLKNLRQVAENCSVDNSEPDVMKSELFDVESDGRCEKSERRRSIKAKLEREKKKLCINMNLSKAKTRSPVVKRLGRTPLKTKPSKSLNPVVTVDNMETATSGPSDVPCVNVKNANESMSIPEITRKDVVEYNVDCEMEAVSSVETSENSKGGYDPPMSHNKILLLFHKLMFKTVSIFVKYLTSNMH